MNRGMRLRGLDAIRFCCALIVVVGHLEAIPLFPGPVVGFRKVIMAGLATIANGPAAVAVFFVLSGLVIHYPTALKRQRVGVAFFLRRYIRIGGPILVAIPLATWVGHDAPQMQSSVLWSLWCELIYYTLYPGLLVLGGRLGWGKLTAIALLPAYAVSIVQGNGNFVPGNVFTSWMVGLPCWLTGCLLAERLATGRAGPVVSFDNILAWRIGMYMLSVALLILRFHTPLTYSFTLVPFSFLVAVYLLREIAYCDGTAAGPSSRLWRWLERAGAWSYSLYLVHFVLVAWFRGHPVVLRVFDRWPALQWTVTVIGVVLGSYLFSLLIERPSHRLARWSASFFPQRQAAPSPAAQGQIG